MSWLFSKKVAGAVLLLALIAVCAYWYLDQEVPIVIAPEPAVKQQVIGQSVDGRQIESYTYGKGATRLLFVGGMHGGYEWNSVLLAYKAMDYFEANLSAIPQNISVTIIPNLNPDGVYVVTGKEGRFEATQASTDKTILGQGRFNANKVDLNRNFDCKWQPQSTWQSKLVSAGTGPFSEPESLALRNFVLANKPQAVVFWHSQANAVYASECEAGILPQTLDIMAAYATAAGYTPVKSFNAYPITGDAEGWLASLNIPAITVELKTHETIEWDKNLGGIKALLRYYSSR